MLMPRQAQSGKNSSPASASAGWTFLTNHAHVLLCLAGDPDLRLRDVADRVGITERSVQHIVQELEAAGAVSRHRVGRRNRYEVHADHRLHHPVEAHCVIGDLIAMVQAGGRPAGRRSR